MWSRRPWAAALSCPWRAWTSHEPSTLRVIGGHLDPTDPDDIQEYWNCIAAKVQLFFEGTEEPVATWTTKNGSQLESVNEFRFDNGPIERLQPRKWRLRVTNPSNKVMTAIGGMGFVRDQEFVGETRVPLRVLNHAFAVLLDAIAPRASIANGVAHVSFGAEVAETFGLQGDHPFGNRAIAVDLPVDVTGHLVSVDAKVCAAKELLDAVEERWLAVRTRILALQGTGTSAGVIQSLLEANDQWKADWQSKVAPNLVAVHIEALASTIDLEGSWIPGIDLDLGSIKDLAVHVYLAFLRDGGKAAAGHVLVLAPADVTGAAGLGVDLGIIPNAEEFVDALLRPPLEEHFRTIYHYFAEVLARISPFLGGIPPIFLDAEAGDDFVLVRVTSDPADQRATVPPAPEGRPVPARGPRVPDVRAPIGETRAPPSEAETFDPGPLGAVPDGFLMGDAASVARLDKIDTIVVVMMENRSFDHMLGFLRQVRGEQYDGFRGTEANTYLEDGVAKTVRMVRARDAVQPPLTQIRTDPFHGTAHVKAQIADGAMSGFASDLHTKGDPQLALTYYTQEELSNIYKLAADFMVCDRWFAAHPGGTYPNRWATLGGTMPELKNLDVDDPRLGFIRDGTIFDILDNAGVTWNYFDNSISMIRMYSSYRLDDSHVLPYDDENDGFLKKARDGRLPQVVFIDPRFTGIPPLHLNEDDHPPADLRAGQRFIARVYNDLIATDYWNNALLLITYDEHGGFYDHVAPPGTDLGPAEWKDKIPLIHPQGENYMGPRVPTLVISPYVNPGSVSHTVFDHTSIIKTILVRHRARFYKDQFGRFGQRVMMINHLGAALDRDTRRPDVPQPLPRPVATRSAMDRTTPFASPMQLRSDGDREDFNVSLARAMLPKLR
jgi:phospholipase C